MMPVAATGYRLNRILAILIVQRLVKKYHILRGIRMSKENSWK
jgi:hypothetical protein